MDRHSRYLVFAFAFVGFVSVVRYTAAETLPEIEATVDIVCDSVERIITRSRELKAHWDGSQPK